ncbi:hypothetical protein AC20117_15305 [Arthrobacter crystallopoietes]|nr:hypothetical protein AC20117_15305 [Arthrobacter crystallopoietes]
MKMAAVYASDIAGWQDISSKHFVPLRCASPEATFRGSLVPLRLADDVSLCRVSTGPVRVERTDRLAQSSENDDVLLSLQLASSGTVRQHGRAAQINPGCAILYETNRPYVLDHLQTGQELLVLRVGRGRLGIRDRLISELCGRTLDRKVPGMAAFSGYLRGLADDAGADDFARQDMARAGAELLAMVLRSFAGLESNGWDSDAALLAALRSYINDHLANPALTVEMLAREHHVSVRKVHSVFSDIGQTPAVVVRGLRLNRAASMLASRAPGQTVASIGAACGIADPTTFNRAFLREFGCSPSKWQPSLQT